MTDLEIAKTLATRAIKGIVKQGKIAFDESNDICRLRTEGGLACAVGQLIDDEEYVEEMEEEAAPSVGKAINLRKAIAASNPDLDLDADDKTKIYWEALDVVQSNHDNAHNHQWHDDDTGDVKFFVGMVTNRLTGVFGITIAPEDLKPDA